MMKRKTLKIGIMSAQKLRVRTIAIARGEYKPKPGEPKIWFTSINSLSQVLSDENQALLQVIADKNPSSLKELEELTGRRSSNLSRTLHTMERYGIVQLQKIDRALRPVVRATSFDVRFGLDENPTHAV